MLAAQRSPLHEHIFSHDLVMKNSTAICILLQKSSCQLMVKELELNTGKLYKTRIVLPKLTRGPMVL